MTALRPLVLVLMTLFVQSVGAQPADPLAGWIGSAPVEPWSTELTCANYSTSAWAVSSEGGRVTVKALESGPARALPEAVERAAIAAGVTLSSRGVKTALRIDRGWFLGVNRGEFEGGGLWWLPDRGGAERIDGENVNALLTLQGRHFALVGLSHMESHRGRIVELTVDEGRAVAKASVDLGDSPEAMDMAPTGELTVACPRGVARVDTSGGIRWLSRSDFAIAYPQSIASDSAGNVYVGMNRFVVKLERNGADYRERWYRTADCATFKLDLKRFTCGCVGSK